MYTVFDAVKSLPELQSLCQTRRGLNKSEFYFGKFTFKIIRNKIFESINFFKICSDDIKINSYINLGDGVHIKIVWSCSNAVKKTQCKYIP